MTNGETIPRLPMVPAESEDPDVKPLFDAIRAKGSEPLYMHRTLAHAPKMLAAMSGMAFALRYDTQASRSLRELVVLRACRNARGAYEIAQHEPMALAAGLSAEQVAATADWRAASCFDDMQRAVLAYIDAIPNGPGVPDDVFAALRVHFSARQIVELTLTATFYTALAMTTNALDIAIEDWPERTYGTD